MNPEEYAEKAVTIEFAGNQNGVDIYQIVMKFGYPEPVSGSILYFGPRGETSGNVDWVAGQIRVSIEKLISDLADDFISAIKQTDLNQDSKDLVEKTIKSQIGELVN